MDHGEWAKVIGGGVGSFFGALLVRLGIRRAKERLREEVMPPEQQPRQIVRGEWHDLREDINKLVWKMDRMERDLARIDGKTDEDHDLLNTAISDLGHMKAELNTVRDHCDHCPGHGLGGRR